MARVIAVANQKGGVGKTTATRNIGAALVERGLRVLLVDADPQGALTLACGLNPAGLQRTLYDALLSTVPLADVIVALQVELHLVPATIDLAGAEVELVAEIGREQLLRGLLASCLDRYDVVLIDCPPSLGLLTVNALTAADGVLIPVQAQYLAFRGMQQLLRTIERVRERANPRLTIVGLLPTLVDLRTTHAREVLDELRETYPALLIDEPVRYRVGLADAVVAGQSIFDYDPRSDVAEVFRRIAEVIARAEA